MYRYSYWDKNALDYGSLNGFLNHSLAYFNTSDLERPPESPRVPADVCRYEKKLKWSWLQLIEFPTIIIMTIIILCFIFRYQTYRYSYNVENEALKYKRSDFYWKVWMARLAFVVIFEVGFNHTQIFFNEWVESKWLLNLVEFRRPVCHFSTMDYSWRSYQTEG